MKNLVATTQLGGFNQRILMRQSNKSLPYSGPYQHEDDAIVTFFSSVKSNAGTTDIELIFGKNTLLTYVYAIGSKSGPDIAQALQDRFRESGITINIWYNNAQEEFMGAWKTSVRLWSRKLEKWSAQTEPESYLTPH